MTSLTREEGAQTFCDDVSPGERVFLEMWRHIKVMLNSLISKRLQMKYSEHFQFLDNELSQLYAYFTCSTPSRVIISSLNAYYIIKYWFKTCSFWNWKFCFSFCGVGSFVTSYLRGMTFGDAMSQKSAKMRNVIYRRSSSGYIIVVL